MRRQPGILRRSAKALGEILFPRTSWRLFGLPRSGINWESEVGDGTSSSTVAAPLQWIARTFPEAPVVLWKQLDDGQEELDAGHEMIRLLHRPNPHYTGALLWMAVITEYNAAGEAFILKRRNNAGAVKELWWAPTALMTPQGDETTFISHYDYAPNGLPVKIDPEDVIHFRFGLDSDNPRRGSSPLKSVLREVFTDDEAANFTAALLRNMGVPGLLVSPEGTDNAPGPDDVKATKEYIANEYSGDGRGQPLVMSGPTKIQQFGFSPEQLNLKALRRIPEERVSAVLGVPAIVAGLGAGLDRSTFSNMGEAREMAYEGNIIPAQSLLAEDLRFQLLSDFEDDPWTYRVAFDTSKVRVLQEDEGKKVERLDLGIKGGWVKVSEGRRQLGLDTDQSDEIYLRSIATIEVSAGQERPEILEEKARHFGFKAARYQTRLVQALDRDVRVLTAALSEELESDFDELGREAARAFENAVPVDELSNRTNGHRKATEDNLAARVMAAMGMGSFTGRVRKRYETHYRRTAHKTVDTINTVLDLGIQLSDPREAAIVAKGGTRRGLLDMEEQTRKAIADAIALGREDQLGPKEIARLIREQVPAGPFVNSGAKYRAELISRTETKYAQNLSSLEAYREADTVNAVLAFDARLGDSDEDCMARDGQTFTFEQAEHELGLEHPNGTLSFAPVVGQPEGAIA